MARTARGRFLVPALLCTGLLVSACSGSGNGSSTAAASGGGSLPAVVKIAGIVELSGPIAFTTPVRGEDLAVKQINDTGYLGTTKMELQHLDGAFNRQLASQHATKIVGQSDVSAILGPVYSAESLAVAPIAQQGGIPIIYAQSGVNGLLQVGDFQFRITPPVATIYKSTVDYAVKKGLKTASIIGPSDNPTYVQLYAKTLPGWLSDAGIKLMNTYQVESSVTDYQSIANKVVADNPDVTYVNGTGSQVPTAISQLRQAGYKGLIFGTNGVMPKVLAPAGEAGVGVTYPTTFSNANPAATSQHFVEEFKKQYNNELPNLYEAEGYDRVWWVARAIKESGSAERAKVRDGLLIVGKQGFDGAQGKLTFADGRDARIPNGFLVEWTNDRAVNAGEKAVS